MSFRTIRFYVCGIDYDKDNCVTDYEYEFGDFDTYYNIKIKGEKLS